MEGEGSMENFLKWAVELGISDSPPDQPPSPSCLGRSLRVGYFHAGGRGLAAVRELRKGELILRVPKSALMTKESLLKDQTLSIAVSRHRSLSSTQIFTVCLLNEVCKGKSSWWFPYLMQLPRSYDILASFGAFEIQSLQVDDAIWTAEKAIQMAKLEWQEAITLMKEIEFKHSLRTFRAWLWAFATISSRSLHIPWDNAGCLCPVGDLFNYAAPGEEVIDHEDTFTSKNSNIWTPSSLQDVSSLKGQSTEESHVDQADSDTQRLTDGGYDEDISAYCFYARRNYKKGEQVLLGYGTYTNLELLEHYGFLLDNNPNDKVFIPLESEIYSFCSWPKDSLCIHPNGKPSFTLICSVRLWLTPPFQRKSLSHLAYSGSQVSIDNEVNSMRWMANSCHVALNSCPTSIEEDRLLLHRIDRLLGASTHMELEEALFALGGEAHAFIEARGLLNSNDYSHLLQSSQARRSMDRWKLAVNWRLDYKGSLANCISYCNEVVNNFISQGLHS